MFACFDKAVPRQSSFQESRNVFTIGPDKNTASGLKDLFAEKDVCMGGDQEYSWGEAEINCFIHTVMKC